MFLSSKIKGLASAILLSQSLSIPLLANEQILEEENIVQGEACGVVRRRNFHCCT